MCVPIIIHNMPQIVYTYHFEEVFVGLLYLFDRLNHTPNLVVWNPKTYPKFGVWNPKKYTKFGVWNGSGKLGYFWFPASTLAFQAQFPGPIPDPKFGYFFGFQTPNLGYVLGFHTPKFGVWFGRSKRYRRPTKTSSKWYV